MGAPATRADGAWYTWGPGTYHFRHKLGGGVVDATKDQTAAVVSFLQAVPDGAYCDFRGTGTLLLDSVNLSLVGKKRLVLDLRGVTLLKNPTGTGGVLNEGHLFKDRSGLSEGLTFLGGTFNLNRSSWTAPDPNGDPGAGDLVSAFFFIRCRKLTFIDVEVVDGIEEGGKFYNCQDVTWLRPNIRNTRNNGLQFHAPLAANQGFQGDDGQVPNQAQKRIRVIGGYIGFVDDGANGVYDGQAVTFNHLDDAFPTEDCLVEGVTIERTIRGLWCEINTLVPARGVRFVNNLIMDTVSHGIGMAGVEGGKIVDNTLYRMGSPASQSTELTGIVVTGSASIKCSKLEVRGNTVIDDRSTPVMEYGYDIKQVEDSIIQTGTVVGATKESVRVDPTAVRCKITTNPTDRVELGVTSSQAIADGTEHIMEWDAVTVDTNDLHPTATQADRQIGFRTKKPGTIAHDIRVGVVGSKAGRLRLYRRRGAVLTLMEQDSGPAITDPPSEETTYSIKGEISGYEVGDELLVYFTAWVRSGATLAMASAGYQTYFKARHVGG